MFHVEHLSILYEEFWKNTPNNDKIKEVKI